MSESLFLQLDITLSRGGFDLTANVEIPMVGITAVKGISGSGKTSLLRAIAGLEPETRGRVRMNGEIWQDSDRFVRPQKRRIGYVFQNARLFPHLNVSQNLAYGWRRQGMAPRLLADVIEALDLGQLLPRDVAGLSGGERQRVAIGRALASGAKLLLLDEPLSGLDGQRRAQVLTYIAQALAIANVPALYVSHYQREIDRIADRVLDINEGRVGGPTPLPRLIEARIVATDGPGRVRLRLGGQDFDIAFVADVGETVGLRLSAEDILLSRVNPGPSTAALILSARLDIVNDGPADAYARLSGEEWETTLPMSGDLLQRLGPENGGDVWISISENGLVPVFRSKAAG